MRPDTDESIHQLYPGYQCDAFTICRNCGIYTHNEMLRFPGKARVNLGCIDDVDTGELEVVIFDGKNLL